MKLKAAAGSPAVSIPTPEVASRLGSVLPVARPRLMRIGPLLGCQGHPPGAEGLFIGSFHRFRDMAKSDSFFIRAAVDVDSSGNYAQTEIDLGSFVNLGVSKSTLLRIHNIAVAIQDGTIASITPELPMYSDSVPGAQTYYQLTTQSYSDAVGAWDKSIIATGQLTCFGNSTSTAHAMSMTHDADVMPQRWTNGYLVGVDSIFLGAESGGTWDSGPQVVSVVLECTLENATQASATALALSQQ